MKKTKEPKNKYVTDIRKKKKIYAAATEELIKRLRDEDWYIPAAQSPVESGNKEGYWIQVQFFIKKPK